MIYKQYDYRLFGYHFVSCSGVCVFVSQSEEHLSRVSSLFSQSLRTNSKGVRPHSSLQFPLYCLLNSLSFHVTQSVLLNVSLNKLKSINITPLQCLKFGRNQVPIQTELATLPSDLDYRQLPYLKVSICKYEFCFIRP